MRIVLLLIIRLYWLLVPPGWRRPCLFRVSCSKAVYEAAKTRGFLAGIKALRKRYMQCRPGYRVILENQGGIILEIANGEKIPFDDVSENVLALGLSLLTENNSTGMPKTV